MEWQTDLLGIHLGTSATQTYYIVKASVCYIFKARKKQICIRLPKNKC